MTLMKILRTVSVVRRGSGSHHAYAFILFILFGAVLAYFTISWRVVRWAMLPHDDTWGIKIVHSDDIPKEFDAFAKTTALISIFCADVILVSMSESYTISTLESRSQT